MLHAVYYDLQPTFTITNKLAAITMVVTGGGRDRGGKRLFLCFTRVSVCLYVLDHYHYHGTDSICQNK